MVRHREHEADELFKFKRLFYVQGKLTEIIIKLERNHVSFHKNLSKGFSNLHPEIDKYITLTEIDTLKLCHPFLIVFIDGAMNYCTGACGSL